MNDLIQTLARELDAIPEYVENVVRLIDEGPPSPSSPATGRSCTALWMTKLRLLADRLQYLRGLAARKEEVRAAIEGQGKLTEVLAAALDAAATLAEVEDLYRPYKQKRRTRASMARERGLEPLAALAAASGPAVDLERAARDYVDPEKGVETVEAALQGASDILAEEISDRADLRKELRQLYLRRGVLISKAAEKEPEDSVYRLYYDFKCPVSRVQGYQTLAINRGEREKLLKVSVELDLETARVAVRRRTVPGPPPWNLSGGGGRRLGAAASALSGAGAPGLPHRAGRRGGHPHLCAEFEAPADATPGEGQGDHGPRPRLPHGVQGGGGRRHWKGAGHRGGLSHPRSAAEGGGHCPVVPAGAEARGGAHRHRKRHCQP